MLSLQNKKYFKNIHPINQIQLNIIELVWIGL